MTANGAATAIAMLLAAAKEGDLLVADVYSEECWANRHDECATPSCACGCTFHRKDQPEE